MNWERKMTVVQPVQRIEPHWVDFFELSVVVAISPTHARLTSACLTGPGYVAERDRDFDNRLAEVQHPTKHRLGEVFTIQRDRRLLDMVRVFPGITKSGSYALVCAQLIAGQYTLTLPQFEQFKNRAEAGYDVGLCKAPRANLFFTMTSDGTLAVVQALWSDRGFGLILYDPSQLGTHLSGYQLLLPRRVSF